MSDREIAVKIAWSFLGQPYIWGGDDPIQGFDCSGLIIEILKSLGYISENEDYSANSLASKFNRIYEFGKNEIPLEAGDLIFWQIKNSRFSHVELAIGKFHSIGASGGGNNVKSIEDAIKYNAFIKVRPIKRINEIRKVFYAKLIDFKK